MIKNILIILLFFNFSIYAQKYQELSLRKIKKYYNINYYTSNDILFYTLSKNELSKNFNAKSIRISSFPPNDTSFFQNVFVISLTQFSEISKFKNGFLDIIRIVDTNNILAIFIDNTTNDDKYIHMNLPKELLKFKNLKYLNIDQNINIPYWLTELKKLEYIYI